MVGGPDNAGDAATADDATAADAAEDGGGGAAGPRHWMGFVGLASKEVGDVTADYRRWRGREAAGTAYDTDGNIDGDTRAPPAP